MERGFLIEAHAYMHMPFCMYFISYEDACMQEVRATVGIFEGEINIYEKETEKGLEKFLKIKKMTKQKYSKSELSLQEEKL